jgi:protoporphyrinogen/coproporphyrinogen III oxidase
MGVRDVEVVVVGAGLAGLNAARLLQGAGCRVLVLERDEVPGGRVRSARWQGCPIELGAAYFTADYERFIALVDELGLAETAEPFPHAFRTELLRDGRWHYVDYRSIPSFVRYRGIGLRDKLSVSIVGLRARTLHRRALRHFDVASAAEADDRSGQSREALRYFYAPPFEAFCQYRAEEVSVALQEITARFQGRPQKLSDGLGVVPARLAEQLEVECRTEVAAATTRDGAAVIRLASGDEVTARACVVATPGDVAASLVGTHSYLDSVRYTPFAELLLRTAGPAARRAPSGEPLYMRLAPPGERDGNLHSVVYLDHLAPSGGLLLAAPAPGGDFADWADDALADGLQAEVEAMHPDLEIIDRRLVRGARMVPVFEPGRAARLREFRASLRPGPVDLAGDWLYGPTMESALMAGEAAAARVKSFLGRI